MLWLERRSSLSIYIRTVPLVSDKKLTQTSIRENLYLVESQNRKAWRYADFRYSWIRHQNNDHNAYSCHLYFLHFSPNPKSTALFYAGFKLKQILSTWWETYSLHTHTQKKNDLTLLSLYVQPRTKHPVWWNGKPWRPCTGVAGSHVTDSPSRGGRGRGNSLKKRMLGRQKRGCVAQNSFIFVDKTIELSPKKNQWLAYE